MTRLAAEFCIEKSRDQLSGQRFADDARPENQQIHVVVFDPLPRGIAVVANRGPHPANLVGRDRGAHATSTQQYSPVHLTTSHRMCGQSGEIGIVVRRIMRMRTEIDRDMSQRLDDWFKKILQSEPGVIGGKSEAHESRLTLSC